MISYGKNNLKQYGKAIVNSSSNCHLYREHDDNQCLTARLCIACSNLMTLFCSIIHMPASLNASSALEILVKTFFFFYTSIHFFLFFSS